MKLATSGKRHALIAGVALAGLYAARKLTRREKRVEEKTYIWEPKDTTHIPDDVAQRQMDVYERALRRYADPRLLMTITNPSPLGDFARRQREQYVHDHKRDPDVFVRHYGRAGVGRTRMTFTQTGDDDMAKAKVDRKSRKKPTTKQVREADRAHRVRIGERIEYQIAASLVEKQLVLTNEQKDTFAVLDEMTGVGPISVEHSKNTGLKSGVFAAPYDALIALRFEGGCEPTFTVGPDGALRAADEDDGGDEAREPADEKDAAGTEACA